MGMFAQGWSRKPLAVAVSNSFPRGSKPIVPNHWNRGGNGHSQLISLLLGAGGGGSGAGNGGVDWHYDGGAGAGAGITLREKLRIVRGLTYTIEIGAGGLGGQSVNASGSNGSDSTFNGNGETIRAGGGGAGAGTNGAGNTGNEPNGGNGGSSNGTARNGVIASAGRLGGQCSTWASAGGAGAAEEGQNYIASGYGTNGGRGTSLMLLPIGITLAAHIGGGGRGVGSTADGIAYDGGGTNSAGANTCAGAGGTYATTGYNGGSGKAIISHTASDPKAVTTGATYELVNGYHVYTFHVTGTIIF